MTTPGVVTHGPCSGSDATWRIWRPTVVVILTSPARMTPPAGVATSCYRIGGGRHTHHIRGTKWKNSMVGVRMMGKVFDNFDFTLNYMYKRVDSVCRV